MSREFIKCVNTNRRILLCMTATTLTETTIEYNYDNHQYVQCISNIHAVIFYVFAFKYHSLYTTLCNRSIRWLQLLRIWIKPAWERLMCRVKIVVFKTVTEWILVTSWTMRYKRGDNLAEE